MTEDEIEVLLAIERRLNSLTFVVNFMAGAIPEDRLNTVSGLREALFDCEGELEAVKRLTQ